MRSHLAVLGIGRVRPAALLAGCGIGRLPLSLPRARCLTSSFRRLADETVIRGVPRQLIKLHVSELEAQQPLDERNHGAAQASEQHSAGPPPSVSSGADASQVHPTVASYGRDDVLSAEPATVRALAEAGHPFAQHYLGVLLMTGSEGQPLDRAEAVLFLHRSTQHQQQHAEPLSYFFLAGLLEERRRGERTDTASALPLPSPLSLYLRYCETSEVASPFHYESLFRAARLLLQADTASAAGAQCMERAARGGHAEAMLHVAQQRLHAAAGQSDGMEANPLAVTSAEQEAREWMQKARDSLEKQLQHEASSSHIPASRQATNRTATRARLTRTERRHR